MLPKMTQTEWKTLENAKPREAAREIYVMLRACYELNECFTLCADEMARECCLERRDRKFYLRGTAELAYPDFFLFGRFSFF